MKVHLVIEHDDYGSQVAAVYESAELANEHAAAFDLDIEVHEVLEEIMPIARDEAAKRKHRVDVERERQNCERTEKHWHDNYEAAQNLRIDKERNPRICACLVFSADPMWTEHGYCRYCGGWSPETMYAAVGYQKLQEAIGGLDSLRYQKRMREIVRELGLEEWPEEISA